MHAKPILTSPDTLSLCEGQLLKIYTNTTVGSTYTWSDENNNFIANGASTNVIASSIPSTYFVNVLDAIGCVNEDSIVAIGRPIPNFSINNAEICADSNVQFEVTTTNIPSNLRSQISYE